MAEFIWNGVGLTTPDGWEPSAIERDGLAFENNDRPACELKWNVVQGSFSFDKHIKRLTKGHKNAALNGVGEDETPPAWTIALEKLAQSGIRAKSFIWQTDVTRGIGATLHNPATGLAALIQFFIHNEQDAADAAATLATFRDYSAGKTIPWAMFGLKARIHSEFRLDTFSFKPGHYTIKYWRPKAVKKAGQLPAGKGPGTHLIFERYAPASVLLKDKPLTDWALEYLEDAPPESVEIIGDDTAALWNGIAKTSLLRAILRRTIYTQGRVWTTDGGNAILSVITHGHVPAPEQIFTDICESYEFV